ncbi:hypothetical protein SAMN04488112_103110 [Melghirimyces thermohalophilus]|uniref:Uncharacterized protein n=1 Tax=Melghirimyces thermohalophilus TaxID=1236220 RepID=A0A1G6IZ59_9BACL|nr:hypothetical protein SAMN04488112_103110 [Melghirimyces thermohalophilus]
MKKAQLVRKSQAFPVPRGRTFNLSCDNFNTQVARIRLRRGDFIRVTCRGRTALVFNSFFGFNRGRVNLRQGEWINFFGT